MSRGHGSTLACSPASGGGGARLRRAGADAGGGRAPEDISCREIVEIVTDYLEGALAPEQREAVELHLNLCDGCSDYLEQMRLAISLTGRLPADALSPELEAELCRAFAGLSRP